MRSLVIGDITDTITTTTTIAIHTREMLIVRVGELRVLYLFTSLDLNFV